MIFLAVLASMLLAPLDVGLASAQTTSVTVSPQVRSVGAEQNFSVSILVDPATAIAGAQFDLHFDPSLLTVTGVEEGNLFKQGGASTYFQSGTIDNVAGTVTGVASVILGPNSVSSPGTLAIVRFRAKTTLGTSSITLPNVIVGDPNGQQVSTSVAGGSVHITTSGENSGSGENAELVYDDFNDGELGTNLGGLAGPMSPGAAYDPTIDFSSGAEGTYALSLTYDFPSGQWCGYWSFANDGNPDDNVSETMDVSDYASLKFYLKGSFGGERFKIELTDSTFDASSQESYLATQRHKAQIYVQATSSWQDMEIPISDFTARSDLNLTHLRQVNIVFDKLPRSGTVYMDKIRFAGTGESNGGQENQAGEQENQSGSQENQSNAPPTAYIDFIEHPATIHENTRVVFSGHGDDLDGTITGYLWASNIDGPLSTISTFDTVSEGIALSPGTHQIRFKVQDDRGAWSSEVTRQLTVTSSVSLVEGSGAGSEQSESSSRGSNGNVLILLGLEAAVVIALAFVVVAKKLGYLKPAIEHLSKKEAPATRGRVEPVSPRISLSDLATEVSGTPRHALKGRLPDIPEEKWNDLRRRLRRLMNSNQRRLQQLKRKLS